MELEYLEGHFTFDKIMERNDFLSEVCLGFLFLNLCYPNMYIDNYMYLFSGEEIHSREQKSIGLVTRENKIIHLFEFFRCVSVLVLVLSYSVRYSR